MFSISVRGGICVYKIWAKKREANDHRHNELCCHISNWFTRINSLFIVNDFTKFLKMFQDDTFLYSILFPAKGCTCFG
jgi:hypothetical protein